MTTRLLRRIRKERGFTLQSLAKEAGCSHATIVGYESGRIKEGRPSVRAGIERALGVPIEVLLMPDQNDDDRPARTGRQEFATTSAAADLGAAKEGASDGS